jgi:hypothetical protein
MWYNPLVTRLLRSPLRGLMDRTTLLLTYTGRKSGRSYTFPISYGRAGDHLRVITRRSKPWWKNIGPGLPVSVWLRGQRRTGTATVAALPPAAGLTALFSVYKGMPRHLAEKLLPEAVIVEIALDPER